MECYVLGCRAQVAGEIELLVGNDFLIPVHLCRLHYRKAWDAERIGWFGGSGVD